MVMLDNGEIESESSSDDEMTPLEDCSNMKVVKPINGDILVTSCTNRVSTIIVEKINLQTDKHTRPYKLQWLSNIGEVKVDKQVSVSFAIENYEDEVLCDVVLMEAKHILLGP
ncbi:hypothetical protein CR513_55524, partial [Mucuna pruriens]